MFRNNFSPEPIEPVLDKNGRVEVAGVDQFDGQDFNAAENGFRRSDISQYFHAESEDQMKAILQRFNLARQGDANADLSDAEIAQSVIPRYYQTAAEFQNIADRLVNDKSLQALLPKSPEPAAPQPVSPEPAVTNPQSE